MNRVLRDLVLLWPRGGIRWLLRDEFSDTRAAGSVNGTPATPGPGTRTVVDTGNNLTIGGGQLVTAGSAGIGDPALTWNQTFDRDAGRVAVGEIDMLVGDRAYFGFKENQLAATPNRASFYFNNAEVNVYDDGIVAVGSFGNTTYRLAIVLRTRGIYAFIQGGAFTNWTLLWAGAADLTGNLYLGYYGRTDIFAADYARVPDTLWLPTPSAYDTFTRANGPIGVSETTGPDGQVGIPAHTYVTQAGVWVVNANTCIATTLGIVTFPVLHPDVVIRATLTTPAAGVTPAGIVVRWTDANNYWYVRVTPGTAGNDFELVEINAGVPTVRGAADIDPAAATAYTLVVITDGQTIDCYWNNAREIHYTTAALNETQGIHGLRDEGNTNFIFDDLTVFPRGTGGEYSQLNRWSR